MNNIEKVMKIIQIVTIVLIVYDVYERVYKNRKRRVRKINQSRSEYGVFEKCYKEIKVKNSEQFFKAVRMNPRTFSLLLTLLGERLTKYSLRKPIEPENRLGVTLLYLAHGCSPKIIAWTFKISVSTVRKIIYETCTAIWEELSEIYVAIPNRSELERISKSFYEKTGMPNCFGPIDGKHINIVCSRKSGSAYYNDKHKYSIVLLACCDANFTFTFVDVEAVGSKSDEGIFTKSAFGHKILNGVKYFPNEIALPGTNELFPCYFVADSAFPLKRNLMRPYPGRQLSAPKENFNKKLSKVRVIIENAFGILSNRWGVLRKDFYCAPQHVDKIVLATIVLHNFLMLQKDGEYLTNDLVDQEINGDIVPGKWRREQTFLNSTHVYKENRVTKDAFALRDRLRDYLFNRSN